jgi:hypothetical protein
MGTKRKTLFDFSIEKEAILRGCDLYGRKQKGEKTKNSPKF